jgi:hypothetical protein
MEKVWLTNNMAKAYRALCYERKEQSLSQQHQKRRDICSVWVSVSTCMTSHRCGAQQSEGRGCDMARQVREAEEVHAGCWRGHRVNTGGDRRIYFSQRISDSACIHLESCLVGADRWLVKASSSSFDTDV